MNNITVLCSNYNSDKWIQGYLDCLNSQVGIGFNVVFVDAKSTDNSLATIKDYKFRDGINVLIIECDENIGIAEAWNIAVKNSHTKYILNLNTDDRLYRTGILTYTTYLKLYPNVDVFYSPCHVVKDADHKELINIYNWAEYSHGRLLIECICGPFPLLKRQPIVDVGLFNTIYTSAFDYEMWLRLSSLGYSFYKISEPVGSYYHNLTGKSTNPKTRQIAVQEEIEIRTMYQLSSCKETN